MNQSVLIVISAAVLAGVILIILFNLGWYRRQKLRQAVTSNRLEQNVQPNVEGMKDPPTQAAAANAAIETPFDAEPSRPESSIDPNIKSTESTASVPMSHDWWFAYDKQISQLDPNTIETLKGYDRDRQVLGWVAWDEQVLCANRQYDHEFCNVISAYITSVVQLQSELHMKQFELASINSTEGRLLLNREGSIWVALVVDHA